MLLAIDQGNSDTVFGLYNEGNWSNIWRLPTRQNDASDYEKAIRLWFLDAGIKPSEITGIVLSSVVPEYKGTLQDFVINLFSPTPVVLGPEIYQQLYIHLSSPHEIGSDLVANAVAASQRFPKDGCIVVDFGTALTVTGIKDKSVLGVAIAPGLNTAVKSLFKHTAQLPEVPLELPDSVLGKNTIHAIQAGVLHGYIGLVKNLIKEAQSELGEGCKVLATGGLSSVLKPLESSFDFIDTTLTLNGLRIIYEKVTG